MALTAPTKYAMKHKRLIFSQTTVVQNAFYAALDVTGGNEVIACSFLQKNDDLAAKDIEIRVTIDGYTEVEAIAALANDTVHWLYYDPTDDADFDPEDAGTYQEPMGIMTEDIDGSGAIHVIGSLKGHDIKIEIRTTSIPGTNQQLDVTGTYHSLEKI